MEARKGSNYQGIACHGFKEFSLKANTILIEITYTYAKIFSPVQPVLVEQKVLSLPVLENASYVL